jgi:hypothetical protein
MKFVCPLCKSPLSEKRYYRVIKDLQKKEKIQKGEIEKIKKQAAAAQAAVVAARKREKEIIAKAKVAAANARKSGVEAERKRSERLIKGQAAKMKKLQDRLKMMESGATPQTIGLADEKVLVARLEKEFPDDRIEHAGKGGDVLHYVKVDDAEVGCILYECKHTDRIQTDHILQASRDKKTRNADYGIVVTTGTRKGFCGLDQESGVFIVAQAGVLTLTRLCRDSLVTMAQERLDAAQKQAAAKRLMDYVTSPACKTPLADAISHTERARQKLFKEIKQHKSDWIDRHEIYQTIWYDVTHIQKNIGRVLDGQEPLKLEKPKFDALLALPSVKE